MWAVGIARWDDEALLLGAGADLVVNRLDLQRILPLLARAGRAETTRSHQVCRRSAHSGRGAPRRGRVGADRRARLGAPRDALRSSAGEQHRSALRGLQRLSRGARVALGQPRFRLDFVAAHPELVVLAAHLRRRTVRHTEYRPGRTGAGSGPGLVAAAHHDRRCTAPASLGRARSPLAQPRPAPRPARHGVAPAPAGRAAGAAAHAAARFARGARPRSAGHGAPRRWPARRGDARCAVRSRQHRSRDRLAAAGALDLADRAHAQGAGYGEQRLGTPRRRRATAECTRSVLVDVALAVASGPACHARAHGCLRPRRPR